MLDIGTGTGLLSMMAAACGADTVTACEVRCEGVDGRILDLLMFNIIFIIIIIVAIITSLPPQAFYPMAECAREGLAANGFADKVI